MSLISRSKHSISPVQMDLKLSSSNMCSLDRNLFCVQTLYLTSFSGSTQLSGPISFILCIKGSRDKLYVRRFAPWTTESVTANLVNFKIFSRGFDSSRFSI
uniref:Uncharacterized protein n=1 Tax=Cacopsylla melanoneura TaxID=428564 RepID=A0A8D8M192_9HEMI